jgi:hypothetical protein
MPHCTTPGCPLVAEYNFADQTLVPVNAVRLEVEQNQLIADVE